MRTPLKVCGFGCGKVGEDIWEKEGLLVPISTTIVFPHVVPNT